MVPYKLFALQFAEKPCWLARGTTSITCNADNIKALEGHHDFRKPLRIINPDIVVDKQQSVGLLFRAKLLVVNVRQSFSVFELNGYRDAGVGSPEFQTLAQCRCSPKFELGKPCCANNSKTSGYLLLTALLNKSSE